MSGPQILLALQGEAESFTSTATWVQAPATWDAVSAETFAASATYVQVAATWAAVAAEAFAATGSFEQAAAAWSAVVAETFAATATWDQAAATWAAESGETFDTTATWVQATATWDATGSSAVPVAVSGAGRSRRRFGTDIRFSPLPPVVASEVAFTGDFAQAAATWGAVVTETDDELALILLAA